MLTAAKMTRMFAPRFGRCFTPFNREEFEYLSLKYAMKGKYIHFGPDVDYPEDWYMPFHPGDHQITKIRDFTPYGRVWGIHSRFWWRSFVKLANDPHQCIPITFLLDTASPADVFLSAPAERALKANGLLREDASMAGENYAGTFTTDKWEGVHAFKTPSKTGESRVSILGGKLIAESGGVKVDPDTKKIIFLLREATPKSSI